MNPSRFRWGMLFILVGVLLLLGNLGFIAGSFSYSLVWLFPLLLIAIGIEKIFAHTRLKIISYFSTLAFVGVAIAIAVAGTRFSGGDFFDDKTVSFDEVPGIKLIKATVDLDGNDIEIRDARDGLLDAYFERLTVKPDVEKEIDGDTAWIRISGKRRSVWSRLVHVKRDDKPLWKLAFSRNIPLILNCRGDSADISFNLATTPLRSLALHADDAYVYLKLGTLEPDVRVRFKGEDAVLKLRIPYEAGLRVEGLYDDSYLKTIGLHPQDGMFISEGYDTLKSRIDVDLDDNCRSLSIDYY